MKSLLRPFPTLCLGFLIIPAPVLAEHAQNTSCAQMTMQICGITFTAQSGSIGNLITFNLPEKYVTRTATVQCVSDHGNAFYKLTNEAVTSCALRTCPPSAVTVCNTSFPIKTKSHIGDVVKTAIPTDLLIASAASTKPSFLAECCLIDGVEQYHVSDTSGVSCNTFPCLPTTLNVCNATISLPIPAEMGAVFHTVTNGNQPVTVQCIGSGGNRPTYQITDSSAVTCE